MRVLLLIVAAIQAFLGVLVMLYANLSTASVLHEMAAILLFNNATLLIAVIVVGRSIRQSLIEELE